MSNIAVHCRGLTKIYGSGETQVSALRGIDLEVLRGELIMLVGLCMTMLHQVYDLMLWLVADIRCSGSCL